MAVGFGRSCGDVPGFFALFHVFKIRGGRYGDERRLFVDALYCRNVGRRRVFHQKHFVFTVEREVRAERICTKLNLGILIGFGVIDGDFVAFHDVVFHGHGRVVKIAGRIATERVVGDDLLNRAVRINDRKGVEFLPAVAVGSIRYHKRHAGERAVCDDGLQRRNVAAYFDVVFLVVDFVERLFVEVDFFERAAVKDEKRVVRNEEVGGTICDRV